MVSPTDAVAMALAQRLSAIEPKQGQVIAISDDERKAIAEGRVVDCSVMSKDYL